MQTSYGQTLTAALVGMVYGIARANVVKSMSNYSASKNKWTITATAADLATVATLSMATATTETYTANVAVATKTTTELATELAALINADTAVLPFVVATPALAVVTVEFKTTGAAFVAAAGANSTVAETVLATTLVAVPFGAGVCFDGANKCKLMVSGAKFAGVALRDIAQINNNTSNVYDAGKEVSVLEKGEVWVTAMEAVAAGDTAYCSHASGYEGQFRNDNTDALTTGGTFTTATTAPGQLVRVLL